MIGLFGGTFNPVHLGHLRPVLEVYETLSLQQVRWIPSRQPPHREQPEISVVHRLTMLQLALQDTDFVIDERELNRDGPSYMVDTLISLRKDYPSESLALILGMDAFSGLSGWHRWRELLDYTHIIVCSRPQQKQNENKEISELVERCAVDDADQLQQHRHGKIYFQPVTQLAISSTQIREICKRGESPRFLVPTAVSDYINQHQLYIEV